MKQKRAYVWFIRPNKSDRIIHILHNVCILAEAIYYKDPITLVTTCGTTPPPVSPGDLLTPFVSKPDIRYGFITPVDFKCWPNDT